VRVAMAASFSAPGLLLRKKKKTRESDREISSYIYINTELAHHEKQVIQIYVYAHHSKGEHIFITMKK
jgi:hypothetical protein